MKDYEPLDGADAFVAPSTVGTITLGEILPRPNGAEQDCHQKQVRCLVCRRPLGAGERKVHAGRCAMDRQNALQRMRLRIAR